MRPKVTVPGEGEREVYWQDPTERVRVVYLGEAREVGTGRGYRWTSAYSTFTDGKLTYPWTSLRDAIDLAKKICSDLGLEPGKKTKA